MSVFSRAAVGVFVAIGCLSAPPSAQLPVAVGQSQGVPSLAPLLKTVTPSVVSIAVRTRISEEERLLSDLLLQNPLAPLGPEQRSVYTAGSGVIVDAAQGFIVTSGHVVEGAEEILVFLADGRPVSAMRVGVDEEADIAVIRIAAAGLLSITMGDSDRLEVGDFVLAIGNPFSIGQTVTSGIVSALRRRSWDLGNYEDFIQIDAALNLGSSGGALIDLRGQLVGMNAAILETGDANGGSAGIGFAIPVNTVRAIANQLMRYGVATHGSLGVIVTQAGNAQPGVAITRIEPGSAAASAGLRIGDTIRALNTAPLRSPTDLYVKTYGIRAGDTVALDIVRSGQPLSVRARLREQNPRPGRGNLVQRSVR
jgi:S1-C subfamily serine protease